MRGPADVPARRTIRALIVSVSHLLACLSLLVISSCSGGDATSSSDPSALPRPGCFITCPDGFFHRARHLCRPGTNRQFEDVWIERYYLRGDGMEMYLTDRGDYQKQDVVPMPCESYIRLLMWQRDTVERKGVGR